MWVQQSNKKIRKVGLIPARSGSKRVPGKNIRPLNGHPLIAYSIQSALESEVFDAVVCVTDDEQYAAIAEYYGCSVPILRPAEISGDKSPDIEWVSWILKFFEDKGEHFDVFSILRPTSPLRTAASIRSAFDILVESGADSVRAVEKCSQHPGKMWVINGAYMHPILPYHNEKAPWHSSQYAALPEIYVQNASLEMAWVRNVKGHNSIAGNLIAPLVSTGYEGVDVNEEFDWVYLEHLLSTGKAKGPQFKKEAWKS